MSTPQKHHFVPEVYMKSFADSQKRVYQLRKGQKKITQKSIGQIGYQWNLFKINSPETLIFNKIKDPYHIEKVAFKKHENNYSKLLKKVTHSTIKKYRVCFINYIY